MIRYGTVIFLDRHEASEYILAHHRRYLNNLSTEERRIKGIEKSGSIRDIIFSNVQEFTPREKKRIKSDIPFDNIHLKWIIIKTKSSYENGYPHTIGDSIILPKGTANRKLLRHERVHILQRRYKEWFDEYYARIYGFEYLPKLKIPSEVRSRIRANPDTPDLRYGLRINGNNQISHIVPICLYDKPMYGVKSMEETIVVGLSIPTLNIYPLSDFKLWTQNGGSKSDHLAEHVNELNAYDWENGFPKKALISLQRYIKEIDGKYI